MENGSDLTVTNQTFGEAEEAALYMRTMMDEANLVIQGVLVPLVKIRAYLHLQNTCKIIHS